jgi:hypothetical protein
MQKGLGIAALVIAIISIFVPIAGVYLTIFTGALAAFAYGEGFPFGLSSIIINAFNIIFLSPTIWITQEMIRSASGSPDTPYYLPWGLLIIQALALITLLYLHYQRNNGEEIGLT